ncbi:MAG: dihydropteroate synthase, partial [Muribaculaceae bacterium]|nr:dihydropteroate synthase [Muribaculaceae bacterium]
ERPSRAMRQIRQMAPDCSVSIDTYRASVAETAVKELGADIINDISGTNLDPEMVSTIARLKVPYVLTHSRGTLRDMHEFTDYENVTPDVLSELGDRLQWLALEGVNDVIIDPGIGFSKTLAQNYRLIHDLEVFNILHRPVLMGISRKSLITKLLNITPNDALNATTALNMCCLDRGADILRVHDVKAARQAVEIYCAVSRPDTII